MASIGEQPQALTERPVLEPHLKHVWQAFWDLHSDRPSGLAGRASIPFSAIDRWAERYDVGAGDDFRRFHKLLKEMDDAFVSFKPVDEAKT